ncbi:MAG: exodeoxyribonuclease VII small subunit [Candidatus Neomarinimicrobiota bacterium]
MAKKASSGQGQKLTFEEALDRLNTIIAELETEGISLDHSLELFAEGRRLAERCQELLGDAEEKVKILVKTASGFREDPGLPGESGGVDR